MNSMIMSDIAHWFARLRFVVGIRWPAPQRPRPAIDRLSPHLRRDVGLDEGLDVGLDAGP